MTTKLELKGNNILKEQFYDREQTSRDETKLENGRSAIYNTISSKNSLIQHQKQWKPFAEFVTNVYKIKTLSKVELWMIVEFIQQEVMKGLAEKTLKSRITAINHVMVGSGVWKENQKVSLSQLRETGNLPKQKGPSQVYKELTAAEWRDRHKKEYDKNQEVIDLARAFGLRKCEIFGKDGAYKGLTLRNLGHIEGSQTLFVEVIGKGGKYRVAEVREDFSQQMWDKYGHNCRTYPKDYFQKNRRRA